MLARAALAWMFACGCAAAARADCTITATSIAFGDYDVFNATPDDSQGTITLRCTPPETVQVSLSRGSSPTFTPRTLRNGANVLNYNLYRTAARTTIFGDGTGGTQVFTGFVQVNATVTVFGRIPALQDVPVGPYSDTIVATVTF
jgi:spore coat protein U-like protein